MTFFERDLVFVIDSDAKFLFMTDKSEGLLPLILLLESPNGSTDDSPSVLKGKDCNKNKMLTSYCYCPKFLKVSSNKLKCMFE